MPAVLSFNRTDLHQQLTKHEGLRRFLYTDTSGHITGGVGHNFTDCGLTLKQIELILDDDIDTVIAQLAVKAPWLPTLSPNRQLAVIDLAFNLGVTGLLRDLPDVLYELSRGCWECAARRLELSHYAAQVKTRAVDLAAQIRQG